MRVLGIITARGGSKGIPRKNIKLLGGKPLLQYTIETSMAAKRLSRVILSTEDLEIAKIGKKLGVDVPFLRPIELAGDNTPTLAVLQDVVRKIENAGDQYDAIFTLQPTNPFRRVEDIDGAINLLKESEADSVISFVAVGDKHPARMKFIDPNMMVHDPPFSEQFEGQRRQDLPKVFLREGSVYLTLREILMENNSLKGNNCRAWIIPEDRACTIDTPFDWFIAEQLVKYHGMK